MLLKLLSMVVTFLVASFVLSSCSTSKDFKELFPNMNKKKFTNSYQTAFIYGCLNKGTNENFNKFLNDNKDLGLFSEVEFLSHAVVKEADSMGRVYAGKIKPINYGAARDGMPFFSGCIYFSQSEEVLIIIKNYYNKLKKGKLTYDYEE